MKPLWTPDAVFGAGDDRVPLARLGFDITGVNNYPVNHLCIIFPTVSLCPRPTWAQ